jgi:hypothetical protein
MDVGTGGTILEQAALYCKEGLFTPKSKKFSRFSVTSNLAAHA